MKKCSHYIAKMVCTMVHYQICHWQMCSGGAGMEGFISKYLNIKTLLLMAIHTISTLVIFNSEMHGPAVVLTFFIMGSPQSPQAIP